MRQLKLLLPLYQARHVELDGVAGAAMQAQRGIIPGCAFAGPERESDKTGLTPNPTFWLTIRGAISGSEPWPWPGFCRQHGWTCILVAFRLRGSC